MSNKYDVIVIGAGNGGLASAVGATKKGLKTLVLERHNIPGGCASSFVRGRFEFEPSLHELCFVGTKEKPASIYSLFAENGNDIKWCYDDTLFRVVFKGDKGEEPFDVVVKATKEGFIDSMEQAVPGCRRSVETFFELGKLTQVGMDYLAKAAIPAKLMTEYVDFVKMGCYSVDELLDYIKMPKKAQDILKTYWIYLGVPTDDMIGLHFANMVYSYIVDCPAVPHDRSHELSLALVKSIIDNGGDIWYNTEVTSLLFDDKNKVCGVVANGREIYADEVISNAMPHSIYPTFDQGRIPKKTLQLTNARTLGLSLTTAYIGLDCSKEELGIKDYTIFVSRYTNTRKQMDLHYDEKALYIMNCLNVIVPDASPEGTCMLFLTIPLYNKDFPKDLKPSEYKKFKNDLVREYLMDFEQTLGVDVISHIEEISIATPVTFARYLNTPQGTIYGYETSKWDDVMMRAIGSKIEPKVNGLTFVGGHGDYGDGYSSAYSSGRDGVQKILKNFERRSK